MRASHTIELADLEGDRMFDEAGTITSATTGRSANSFIRWLRTRATAMCSYANSSTQSHRRIMSVDTSGLPSMSVIWKPGIPHRDLRLVPQLTINPGPFET
jgi:hypothetical protein